MLVNSIELLKMTRATKSCIPAFNVYNLETIKAAFEASKNTDRPVIIAFGEGYLKYVSFDTIVAIVKSLDIGNEIKTVLHLDHCKDVNIVKKAIDAGFTSVMYDGSHLNFEDNIKNTIEVVNYAHERNVSVEGELGYMNPEDGSTTVEIGAKAYTSPEQAKEYVQKTRIDSLAVVVGNAHGLYKGEPHLEFSLLEKIYKEVNIPLVLHGASGISEEQIKKAIEISVSKINVNTEIALTASRKCKEYLAENNNVRFEILMDFAKDSMVKVMEDFLIMTK